MSDFLTQAVIIGFFAATVRLAVPILYGALGEVISQSSGVVNLSIEAMMLLGAFAGFVFAGLTGSIWVGVAAGMLAGALIAMLSATFTVTLGADQAIVGVMIVIAIDGLVTYLNNIVFGGSYIPPSGEGFQAFPIPVLKDIPYLGEILFQQNVLVYFAFILVPVITIALNKTQWGLRLRGVGENPLAAESMGANVVLTRYVALGIGGLLAGLGGAFLTIAYLATYSDNITAGRGWIAVALVFFGQWTPYRVLIGALFFGGINALQLRLQAQGVDVPSQFMLMMPYLLTILAMLFIYREDTGPASTWIPYRREKRG